MTSSLPRLRLTDLVYDATHTTRLPLRGRQRELEQMARTLTRSTQHNSILSGRRGIGKTALLHGFMQAVVAQKFPSLRPLPYLALDVAALTKNLRDGQKQEEMLAHATAALQSLPPCVLIVDEADQLLSLWEQPWPFEQLFQSFFTSIDHHVIVVVSEEGGERLSGMVRNSLKFFEVLKLSELSTKTCRTILYDRAAHLATQYQVAIEPAAVEQVIELLPALAVPHMAPPRSTINLLDEACAACVLTQERQVTREHVQKVYNQRLGLPRSQGKHLHLASLPKRLSARVQGQSAAIKTVVPFLQRASLGLQNPDRPLGSFLFLGPSGVGKTELAKAVAKEFFGSHEAFIRLDMSEFAEAHMVQRLLGAPPGYVGYEAGGQLTAPVMKRPFSLLLLDEIEKAHPGVFDIFLQLLDDGRLTDGHGVTVDFTKTLIIATSNFGTEHILRGYEQGHDITAASFIKRTLLPKLLTRFRPEFLNRFEAICAFAPLSPEVLLAIAQQEITKVEQRLKHHRITLDWPEEVLRQKIAELYDPRFGARPLKRFIEQASEAAVAQHLLTPENV